MYCFALGLGSIISPVARIPIEDDAGKVPITVADTASFTREAQKLFSDGELEDLRDHVSQFRELGKVIRDTGGLRKLRWATDNNRGKSHGARIIYYYGGEHMPLYLIAVYAKSRAVTLSGPEKKAATKLVAALKKRFEPENRRRNLRVVAAPKGKR
jgi:hypothetical protein